MVVDRRGRLLDLDFDAAFLAGGAEHAQLALRQRPVRKHLFKPPLRVHQLLRLSLRRRSAHRQTKTHAHKTTREAYLQVANHADELVIFHSARRAAMAH
eukprot:746320-Rhodomonas_salina.2